MLKTRAHVNGLLGWLVLLYRSLLILLRQVRLFERVKLERKIKQLHISLSSSANALRLTLHLELAKLEEDLEVCLRLLDSVIARLLNQLFKLSSVNSSSEYNVIRAVCQVLPAWAEVRLHSQTG